MLRKRVADPREAKIEFGRGTAVSIEIVSSDRGAQTHSPSFGILSTHAGLWTTSK